MRRPRAVPRLLAPAVLSCMLSACGREASAPAAPAALRADSAGVEIVAVSAAAADAPVFSTPDSAPSLRIGSLDGRAEEQFGNIGDLLPLPDGGVAVLDRQAAEVRVFDASGAFVRALGKKGEGPGELQNPSDVALLAGDTVGVYDPRPARLTRFAPNGTLGRIVTLETDARGRPFQGAILQDGRVIGAARWYAGPNAVPLVNQGASLGRDSVVLILWGDSGALLDTIDVLPGMESIRSIEAAEQSVSVRMRPAVFGRTSVFAPHPDGIWAGVNDSFELRLRDAGDGHQVRIVRAPGLERPTTDELARRIHERAVADADANPDQLRWIEEWFTLSPRPATAPAYDRILVDDRARLWVREWSGGAPAERWWVFSPAGDLLGSVDFPGGVTLHAVRSCAAWGVEQDELDVGYVVRYALRGPGGC